MSVILSDNETVWPNLWPESKYRSAVWYNLWPQNNCISQWPVFYGPVILPFISKLFDGLVSYFQIMRQCDPTFDLKINIGHARSAWPISLASGFALYRDISTKLGIQDLDVVLRTSRMRWFGHVERSTGWIAEVRKLNVVAQKRSGRPRKSWDEVLENDRKKLGMDSADPQNPSEWRGRLRERLVKKTNSRWRKTGL